MAISNNQIAKTPNHENLISNAKHTSHTIPPVIIKLVISANINKNKNNKSIAIITSIVIIS